MSKMVDCVFLKKKLIGLENPPFPGEKGHWICQNISHQAWKLWLEHQTRLINEKRLNLMEAATRDYLNQQMDQFFTGGPIDQITGYVPE
ncbi:MAG: oxidative damage protection protein [Endozoicomonadaceae bacterium]|nr:oxidative damage protection protein [Endozoicomonadaceae bacterium]